MRIVFLCSSLEPGRDGVGDYTRRLAVELMRMGNECRILSLNDKCQPKVKIEKTESENEKQKPEVRASVRDYLESQQSEGMGVACLRLPSSLGWPERVELAREWVEEFSPDWVSLQFVPFGFHPKGLCFGLGKRLAAIASKASWHIMFHELWVGLGEGASLKHRIWGALQRSIVRDLTRRLHPSIVHTHATAYQTVLRRENIEAAILPLFSNIPLATGDGWADLLEPLVRETMGQPQDRAGLYLAGVFGGVHPEWNTETAVNIVLPLVERAQKRLVLIFCGKNNLSVEAFARIKSACNNRASVVITGEKMDLEISKILQALDLGLATSPRQLIQKSSSSVTMQEHGLPMLATRDDWHLRGARVQSEGDPSGLFSPNQFALLENLPVRNVDSSRTGGAKQVADQVLEAMKIVAA